MTGACLRVIRDGVGEPKKDAVQVPELIEMESFPSTDARWRVKESAHVLPDQGGEGYDRLEFQRHWLQSGPFWTSSVVKKSNVNVWATARGDCVAKRPLLRPTGSILDRSCDRVVEPD